MGRGIGALAVAILGAACWAGGALAAAQSPDPEEPVVACQVMGHDVILYNRGSDALSAGTSIHWSAWNGRREGEHTLEEELEPNIGLQLSSALGASYLWDRPCEAFVVNDATIQ